MLDPNREDVWSMDELDVVHPSELMRMMPELRQYAPPLDEDEVGLRSLLDHPEAQWRAWWRDDGRGVRRTAPNPKRPRPLRVA